MSPLMRDGSSGEAQFALQASGCSPPSGTDSPRDTAAPPPYKCWSVGSGAGDLLGHRSSRGGLLKLTVGGLFPVR